MFKSLFLLSILLFSIIGRSSYASAPMDDAVIDKVKRTEILTEAQQQDISAAAGLLANYEITAKKLINSLEQTGVNVIQINEQAETLLQISEEIIDKTHFRLPQCSEYLTKTLTLKHKLKNISHDSLEKNYHHDGALPKAPIECYHTKDLFVHPATVIVLTRDDHSLSNITKSSINAEITEVLGHLELVRKLVIY